MSYPVPRVQLVERHPDISDLGFVCACGERTRSQLNGWAQWYVHGEAWNEVCTHCGKVWEVTLAARRVR